MLKLEDFKLTEIDTLRSINGGYKGASIWMTKTKLVFLGWVISTGEKSDSCSNCDDL